MAQIKSIKKQHDKTAGEMAGALAGLFTVVRKGLAPVFQDATDRSERIHEGVTRTKENIKRGAGVAGEPFRI